MSLSSFFKFGFAVFLPLSVVASSIPPYEVVDTSSGTVELTNQAVFTINDIRNVRQWNSGDQIELHRTSESFLLPTVNVGGVPVIEPLFIIVNLTQEKYVLGYLSTIPQLNLVTILSMDSSLGTVTLSDSSVWHIRSADQRFMPMWNVGDIVLIGRNKGADNPSYDAFVFNATHSHLAHAVE